MFATHKTQTTRSWVIDLFFITFAISIFYMLWSGAHALFTPDEGRYSEVAREMIATNDYITPRLNGVVFLDKPVLYYWLQASAIKLFGLKEWALRFWPSLMGIFGCAVTYLAGRLLFTRRTGILSAIILATSPLYYGAAHYANLDLEVAVLISNTLLFALLGLSSSSSRQRTVFLIVAYLFAGLAALTKGLIGLAFPILIIGSWIIILNRWRLLRHMHLIIGFLIFIAITAPWYFLVQKANPQFFHFFFITQQFERFLTKADFNNPSPVWFYIPIIFAGFLPWSLFLIQSLTRQIKLVFKNHQQQSTLVFLLVWCLIVFVFFSIPKSKTIGYILPLFPALALLIGHYLNNRWDNKLYKTAKLFSYLTLVAIIFLLILQLSAAKINQKTIKPLALQLKSIATPQDEIITFYRYYQDLPIYLERRITIVADWHASDIVHNDNWVRELWFGMPFQNTADWLIEEPTFWQRWNSHKRVFVLMNAQDYANFDKKTHHTSYKLNEYNNVALVSNQKSQEQTALL